MVFSGGVPWNPRYALTEVRGTLGSVHKYFGGGAGQNGGGPKKF